jgi:MFS family permease
LFNEYRGIPTQATLLIYLAFIPNMAIGFIYSDLSYFLPNIQGVDPFLSGVVITVMGLTLVAESIPLGIVADRYGRRNMLLVGNVCASLSLIGFALTTNFALLVVVAVVEGTGEASFAVSVSALIADHAGNEKRTPAFSLLAFLGWIASGVGGFVIASVASLQSVGLGTKEAHIVLYIAIGLINLGVTPFLLRIKEGTSFNRFRGILPRKSGRVITRYLFYSVLIAVGAGLFVPLMSYWFSAAYGVSDVVSVPVLGVTSLITAFVVFLSPRLANKYGLVRATVLTQASSTIFMVLIPSSPTFGIAASLYVVRVLLMNLSNPLTQSLIMGLVAPDERGMASGITAALWRLPNALSVSAGFALIGAGYLGLPFYIATVLYVVGIGAFWLVFKDARLPEEEVRRFPQAPAQSSSLEGPEVER